MRVVDSREECVGSDTTRRRAEGVIISAPLTSKKNLRIRKNHPPPKSPEQIKKKVFGNHWKPSTPVGGGKTPYFWFVGIKREEISEMTKFGGGTLDVCGDTTFVNTERSLSVVSPLFTSFLCPSEIPSTLAFSLLPETEKQARAKNGNERGKKTLCKEPVKHSQSELRRSSKR